MLGKMLAQAVTVAVKVVRNDCILDITSVH